MVLFKPVVSLKNWLNKMSAVAPIKMRLIHREDYAEGMFPGDARAFWARDTLRPMDNREIAEVHGKGMALRELCSKREHAMIADECLDEYVEKRARHFPRFKPSFARASTLEKLTARFNQRMANRGGEPAPQDSSSESSFFDDESTDEEDSIGDEDKKPVIDGVDVNVVDLMSAEGAAVLEAMAETVAGVGVGVAEENGSSDAEELDVSGSSDLKDLMGAAVCLADTGAICQFIKTVQGRAETAHKVVVTKAQMNAYLQYSCSQALDEICFGKAEGTTISP